MPRGERPIDAEDTALGAFAAELRLLREKAGRPPYRELSSRAHYSAAALSEAAGGKKLPSLAVALAYVRACGGDEAEWELRWRAIAAPPEPEGDAPYAGLATCTDADRFFGREKLTAKLVALTAERRFVGVFGASGSGKSSLLRAGLVPKLDRALVFTPGVSPADECAVRLGTTTADVRAQLPALTAGRTLVVDQFEELFTLAAADQRDWFISALTECEHVVIGVRADFYGYVTRYPELVAALDSAQLMVGPMTPDELRRAITEPARRAAAQVESALVTRLVADVSGQPAALPLMSHALVETWHRRRGMTLALAAYEEAGGVEHAVARSAEQAFGTLSEPQRAIARDIFLRLVVVGDGTDDTKRRVPRHDLDDDVLERLAAARLIVLDRDHVDLAHEALIRSWPRLRGWIDEDRAAIRARQHLSEAVIAWEAHGRDTDTVYRGARLAQARELTGLTGPEQAFLAAGTRVERRRTRALRAITAVLTVLTVLLGATVFKAVDSAQAVARQRDQSLAREAAAKARALLAADPKTATKLALAAHEVGPGDETRDALLSTAAARYQRHVALPDPAISTYVQFTPSGRFLIERDEQNGSWRWDGDERVRLPVPAGEFVRFSGDERRMFVSGGQPHGYRINVQEGERRIATLPAFALHTISDNGEVVAGMSVRNAGVWETDERVHIWDLHGEPRETVLPTERVSTLTMTADGTVVALAAADGENTALELWRVGGDRIARWTTPGKPAELLRMSDDGRVLAVSRPERKTVELWRIDGTPARWAELPESSAMQLTVHFGGRATAVATETSVQMWDLSGDQPRRAGEFTGFRGDIMSVAYRADIGEFVAYDRVARGVWTLRRDVPEVLRQLCAEPGAELTEDEWRTHFPDVERRPVC